MMRAQAIAWMTAAALVLPMRPASAQEAARRDERERQQAEPVEVTHGGYGALTGSLAFALLGGVVGGTARLIYSKSEKCLIDPSHCTPNLGRHVAFGAVIGLGVAGVVASGWAGQKLTQKWAWNPEVGWALTGAYLGLPTTLLLQSAIPKWEPEWSRDVVGVTLGVGGGIGAAFAFRAVAQRRGHAWPEFGFGAGGLGLGLAIGQLVKPNSVWVPILGGVGSVLGASAATLLW